MAALDAAQLLRENLLESVSILVAGAEREAQAEHDSSCAQTVRAVCAQLGASVGECPLVCGAEPQEEEAAISARVDRVLAQAGEIDMLLVEAGGLFAAAAQLVTPSEGYPRRVPARASLFTALELAWSVSRAVANQAFIARERPGRIVYLAPADGAQEHSRAACAGLENLARTLSIEWARHAITPVAIAPGHSTDAQELAVLCAYLASPAGAYFSGCLLDLRGPAASS